MLKNFKFVSSIILFSVLSWSSAHALTCPPIETAIQQLGATSLNAGTGAAGNWHYTGTSSYDGSTIDYYTTVQPTTITPNHQIQRLEPVLSYPSAPVASSATSITCAYLGSATGSAAPFTPTYDPTWGQVILITSGGSSPTPPGPTPPGPPTPVSGLIYYHITLPYVSSNYYDRIPLDSTYTDLIMANYVAGALYAHLIKESAPDVYFNPDYIEGSLFAQLLQENLNAEEYAKASTMPGNYINYGNSLQLMLVPGGGGAYQINNYPDRKGKFGLINFLTLQKSLGFKIAAQDDHTQDALPTPSVLATKYFAPLAAAYFQYNDYLSLVQSPPVPAQWQACVANMASTQPTPVNFLDIILNGLYNAGATDSMSLRYVALCAAPTAPANAAPISNIANYLLNIDAYNQTIGMSSAYNQYPRQIRFILDELYNNTTNLAPSGLAPNNSMPFDLTLLGTVFANSMNTLAYLNGGTYGFIAMTDASTAYSSALISQGLSSTGSLNLAIASQRVQLYALLDAALTNLENNLKFKFSTTTECDGSLCSPPSPQQ